MMRTALAMLVVALAVDLVVTGRAEAGSVRIGVYSQKASPSKARIGASIHVSQRTPARSGRPARPSTPGGAGTGSAPSNPSLKSTSPLLQKTHPAGKGSFWYTTLNGQRCMYVPKAVAPCCNVTPGGRPAPAQPPVDPAVVAAAAAKRLALGPGRIQASPSPQTEGLAGAPSWFWLDPAPAVRSVSVSVRREHVKVTASAREVRWVFGDGSSLAGGPGVPYRSGEDVPDGAVRHDYETRCLPGDQGHDPYVLSSCGPRGYAVTAELAWDISYDASGPVSESGGLPSRTTATSLEYPVSEARGFLTDGGGT